ncbi:MAG: M6 family metalloprotease domain-containing protein, partial [Candidatus Zixiibacteriota bacterium]
MRTTMKSVAAGLILGGLALGASGRFSDADAMPPHPDLASRSAQMAASVQRYNELRATFAERGICQPGGGLAAGTAVSGPFNVLAVCVRFSDHDSSVAPTYFDDMLFEQANGSMWDYYDEISYGTLSLITVDLPSSIGWQLAPQTYAYYVNNNYGFGSYPQNTQKLCEDIVDLINPLVDFSVYDNDGNGYVDGLIITHTGSGAELTGSTSDIWSHKWGITPRLRDGVYISTYTVQPEYWISPGDMTIGVYAHETGHMFGLPDLYDLDNSSRGIGKWSLMANGSWNGSLGNSPAHPDAWCRTELGFCTPTVVSGSISGASLASVESSPTVYRLWEDGAAGSEYFLVENRQRTGFDAALPSAGLLIW